MDTSIHKQSESSIRKSGKKDSKENQEENGFNDEKKQEGDEEIRVELQNSIKKVSYACYLIVFILGLLISSIYIIIKIQNALIVFDDIYQNWENKFILDIFEKQEGVSCDELENQSSLFSFSFQGSRTGCFCEDCSDDGQVRISGLINGKDLSEDIESDDYVYHNDSRRSRRERRRRRLFETLKKRNAQSSSSVYDYSDFELSDLEDIKSYKIIKKGCSDVDSIDDDDFYEKISFVNPKEINYLIGENEVEIKLCMRRSQTHNFFNTLHEGDTECEVDQILCKGENDQDKSYWFCIDKAEKCPIRSLHIVKSADVSNSKYIYEEEVKLSNGYSVLISRLEKDVMPISEIELLESEGPCVSSTNLVRWRLSSSNFIFNPLVYEKQSFKCEPDTRFVSSEFQIDKKSLYKHADILNDMINSNYPLFLLPQQRVKFNLFYRRYIEFAIHCRFFFPEVANLGVSINKLEKMSIAIIVSSSLLCIFQLIDIVYIFMIVWQKKVELPYPWRTNNWLNIIYRIFKYPIALSVCILDFVLFYRMVTCREIGKDIVNRNCSDKITSSQFEFMRNNLSFYGIFFHIIICFCFWSGDLHHMNLIRKYCLMNRKKMTPFDEFFSLPKADKKYQQLNKPENEHNFGVYSINVNENNDNNQQQQQQQLQQQLQLQEIKSLNHIEQQQERQQQQIDNLNNNMNIKLKGQIQSVSQQELGSLPELMIDLSKKPQDPQNRLEKKQSKPPSQAIQNNDDDLIKLEITETDEDEL